MADADMTFFRVAQPHNITFHQLKFSENMERPQMMQI
jgi:hypothetical protein